MGAGSILFDRNNRIVCSRKTGRVRHIYRGEKLIATLRPTDGFLALTVHGARILLDKMTLVPNTVTVQSDVAEFIMKGGNVFAKHIVSAADTIRPSDEVIVTDEAGRLLGVGSALLSGNDMKHFRRGVAVRVRRGTDEKSTDYDD
jgi:predicted RNA-binding protein (TIGR00451 family)